MFYDFRPDRRTQRGQMVKKVQDYYFKKAQKEGYPARSVYKLEEAQKKYRLLRPGDRVLDVGCRPGSWSLYAARVVGGRGLVVGLDLNPGKKLHVTGGAPIITEVADIMDPEVVELIRGHCRRFDVIISDIAPRTTGNRWADQQLSLRLSHRVFELAADFLKPKGNFYCKVFEGEDFRPFVQEVRRVFSMVKIFKPESSRKESREVFILATGFSGKAVSGTG